MYSPRYYRRVVLLLFTRVRYNDIELCKSDAYDIGVFAWTKKKTEISRKLPLFFLAKTKNNILSFPTDQINII